MKVLELALLSCKAEQPAARVFTVENIFGTKAVCSRNCMNGGGVVKKTEAVWKDRI